MYVYTYVCLCIYVYDIHTYVVIYLHGVAATPQYCVFIYLRIHTIFPRIYYHCNTQYAVIATHRRALLRKTPINLESLQ